MAYNRFWTKSQIISSSFSISGFHAFFLDNVTDGTNETAYSISGNLKYSPIEQFVVGLEYMYAYRGATGNIEGDMHRIQLAAKYTFGYHNSSVDEKK